ncbi:MAG: hypothetical protein PWQ25_548 [Deferribacteres bacterium]|jgi:hypothetical protein|nr:hypothetical protein [Deferribacteraceae bacterium]MDK2791685.1 hypothetical protein [Deferribacteres bacterium]
MKKIFIFLVLIFSAAFIFALTDEELFYSKCTSCHGEGIILNKKLTAGQWEKTIKKMKSYGANVSSSEVNKIAEFLARNAGK